MPRFSEAAEHLSMQDARCPGASGTSTVNLREHNYSINSDTRLFARSDRN